MSTDAHSWTDAGDRQLARCIFGTDEWDAVVAMIINWTITQGFGRGRIRSIELSVGAGVTIDLPGQSPIFVKAWAKGTDRQWLSAQLAVQRAMAADGYPAPAVLTDLSALGPASAIAVSYNRDGEPTDARIPSTWREVWRGSWPGPTASAIRQDYLAGGYPTARRFGLRRSSELARLISRGLAEQRASRFWLTGAEFARIWPRAQRRESFDR
jgi:hypothetical protein